MSVLRHLVELDVQRRPCSPQRTRTASVSGAKVLPLTLSKRGGEMFAIHGFDKMNSPHPHLRGDPGRLVRCDLPSASVASVFTNPGEFFSTRSVVVRPAKDSSFKPTRTLLKKRIDARNVIDTMPICHSIEIVVADLRWSNC